MRRDAWLAVLLLAAFLLAVAIWHYPQIGYALLGLLVMGWESETLWDVLGAVFVIVAAIWLINSLILEPLGQIRWIRRDLELLRRDLRTVMDHLGMPRDDGEGPGAPPTA